VRADRRFEYRGYILDVDGVLVRGHEPIPGAAEALAQLRSQGRIVLLTNNSTRSRDDVADRLKALGMPVDPAMIVTSASIVATWLCDHDGPSRVAVLGERGLEEELTAAGHERVPLGNAADWVIVGMDREVTYARLAGAAESLRRGARLAATNSDATYPTPEGPVPGAGAMVGALRGVGYEPMITVGKPNGIAYETALSVLGLRSEEAIVIGDRMETDIAGADAAGLDSLLVLTGVSRESDAARDPGPTWIAEDLRAAAEGRARRAGKEMG
jgi:HAD superfamily hydrolase (TIGR01450 family)